LQFLEPGRGNMYVRIVKSRERHAAGEVDDTRSVAFERQHFLVATDCDDAAIAHGGRLGPGALRVDGIDAAVDEDRVGDLRLGGLSSAAGNRDSKDERRQRKIAQCACALHGCTTI
jgi:hypothetical protein